MCGGADACRGRGNQEEALEPQRVRVLLPVVNMEVRNNNGCSVAMLQTPLLWKTEGHVSLPFQNLWILATSFMRRRMAEGP